MNWICCGKNFRIFLRKRGTPINSIPTFVFFLFGLATAFAQNIPYCGSPDAPVSPFIVDYLQKYAPPAFDNMKAPFSLYKPTVSKEFFTYNFDTEKSEKITATLRDSSNNIYIWVQDSEWNNGHVNPTVVSEILSGLIDNTPAGSIDPARGIVEIINAYFGLPPDIDGDGKTDFLIADIKDGWSGNEGFVAGYFNPTDQFRNGSTVNGGRIEGSNERDMLYIDSYPGIYLDGSYRYDQVLGTVAHEYQHLIHFNYDQNEDNFVNEGLSELSSFLCGYGLRDPSLYLRNTNIDFTGWKSGLPVVLEHYSKTALWTYYLYEKLLSYRGLGLKYVFIELQTLHYIANANLYTARNYYWHFVSEKF